MSSDDRGRGSDAATIKEKVERALPQGLQREHSPADFLYSNFEPPNLEHLYCSKPLSLQSYVTAAPRP